MKYLSKSIVATGLVMAAASYPATLFGQTSLAVRGGMSRATVSSTTSVESFLSARMGLALGASATIPMQENFGLRLDGGYVQKGASFDKDVLASSGLEGVTGGIHIDYIELSGLGLVSLTPSGSPAGANLFVGPSLAFKTGCEISANIAQDSENTSLSESESCGEDFRGIDLGITAGVGMEMGVQEQMKLTLEFRYTMGLLSVNTADDGEPLKNRNLVLLAGVGFPIGQ